MAIEIGALRALLSLDSAAFESGAKRALASMGRLQRSMTNAGKRMQSVGKKLTTRATLPIVALGGAALRSSLQTVDAQSKMAQSIGTSTRSIQVLARAADRAGVSTGEMEQIARQLTKRLSQVAATGKGPAAAALARLGMKASDLADMDLDQKIAVINRAIADTVPEAEQASVAMALFGDRAGLVAGRLDAATIAAANDEIERFGIAVTEIEADRIEEANDAISAIGLVVTGLGNQLAVALAPTLKRVSEYLADLGAWFAQLTPDQQRFAAAAAAVAAAVGPLAIALGFIATGLAALASPVGLVILGFAALAGAAAYVATNWDSLKERFPILQSAADFGARIAEKWKSLPALKWAVLIPALRWARFVPGLKWTSKFIPSIPWLRLAKMLSWGALVKSLKWTSRFITAIPWLRLAKMLNWGALIKGLVWTSRFIPGIGWAALAGKLAWDLLLSKLPWSDWIPDINWGAILDFRWKDVLPAWNWSDIVPKFNFSTGTSVGRGGGGRSYKDGAAIGEDLSSGMADGISAGRGAVDRAAREAVQGAEQAAKDQGEIHSPSRVFARIGRYLMDGAAVGIADNAVKAADAARAAAEQVTGSFEEATQSPAFQKIEQGLSSISDAMAGAIVQGRDMGAALKQVFLQIAQDLLASGIKEMLSGLFGFGGASGGGGGILGAIFGGARADGGPVSAGKAYLVGERGPELHVPKTSGRIIPNDRLRGGGANITLSMPIDARGAVDGVAEQVERVLVRNMPEIERRVVAATYKANSEVPFR